MSTTPSVAAAAEVSQAYRLDVHDDERCRAAYDVLVASRSHGRPWDDTDGYAPTVTEWRYDDPAEPSEKWLVDVGGRPAGLASLWFPRDDNTDKVWFELDVHPAFRRLGVGTALERTVEGRARAAGRPQAIAEVAVPVDAGDDHPYLRFVRAHGYVPETTDRLRALDLPVEDGLLDRLDAASRERWAGAYRLETHVDGLPAELVPGYCRVSNQLNVDAPTGDVDFDAESWTPERYAGYLDLERRQGRRRLTTLAVERATGEVVAYTDLLLPSGAPTKVWQWGTLVDGAHRGHRLGLAVKVANLRELQRLAPERRTVSTGNDATNAHMVAINEQLGFRVVEHARMCRKVLT